MSIFDIISLAGGLALFLYGMRIMGDGLRAGSSSALKAAMEKVTNNPFAGFLLGLLVTAVIQSSTATIVLTSGLVGAGILQLNQSIGIILGANVGTTVTGQIIRLLDINAGATSVLNFFKPSTLAPLAAVAGILIIMLFRFKNSDTIGSIAMGFAILFTGLLNMTAAVSSLSESAGFANLFLALANRPFIGFLAGALVALCIQSSSATVGILQALSVTGQLSFSSVYAIILGIYLGDCVTTAIVCAIGARADAKRTGVMHILFNLSGTVLVVIAVAILHSMGLLDHIWTRPITSGGIANAHTIFKLASALLLLPVCGMFERMARKIVKDDKEPEREHLVELEALDDAFFKSPSLAFSAVGNVISAMSTLAADNVFDAMKTIGRYDQKLVSKIEEKENMIDQCTDSVSGYLVRLSAHVNATTGADEVGYEMKCAMEFERVGDYAMNLAENAQAIRDRNVAMSSSAKEELEVVGEVINEILQRARRAYSEKSMEIAREIEPLEEVVDDIVAALRENHLQRLRDGVCSTDAGIIFMDILTNVERISDQCSNVGVYTLSMLDPEVASLEHDYIRKLHSGSDENFNRMYAELRGTYFGKLSRILEQSN